MRNIWLIITQRGRRRDIPFVKGGLVYCITALKIRGLLVKGAWSRFGLFMLIMFQYQRIPNIR